MKPVAVIDLMGGQVVHARRGERGAYQPILSTLAKGSDPLDVAAALLALFPFDTLYAADLDAILGRGDNGSTLSALRRRFPGVEIWLDAGIAAPEALAACRDGGFTPVLGSESQRGLALLNAVAGSDAVLSLDFRGGAPLGPAPILEQAGRWPRRVIVLDLARVGSGMGPDLDLLASVRRRAPGTDVYAGGGVRGGADLEALRDAGAAGALLASALHDGAVTGEDLKKTSRA